MSAKMPRNEEGSQNGTGTSPAAGSADGGAPSAEDASRNVTSAAAAAATADSLAPRPATFVMTACSDTSQDDGQATKAYSRQASADVKSTQAGDQPEHPDAAASQDSSTSTADEDLQAATVPEQLSTADAAAAAAAAAAAPLPIRTSPDADAATAARSNSAGPGADMSLGKDTGAATASTAAENGKAQGSSNDGKAGARAGAKADVTSNGPKASSNGGGAALVTGLSRSQEYSKSPELLHRRLGASAEEQECITKLMCYAKELKAENARKQAEVSRLEKKVRSLEEIVGEHATTLSCLKEDFARMFAEQRHDSKQMYQEFREYIASVELKHGRRVQDLERRVEAEREDKTRVMKQHEAIQTENRKKISELQALIEELQKRNDVLTACILRYRGQLGLGESDEDWLRDPDTDVSTEGVQETRKSSTPEQDDGQRLQEIAAIQAIVVQQGEQVDDLMSHGAVFMLRAGGGSKLCMVLKKEITVPCHNAFSTGSTPTSPTTAAAYAGTACTETSAAVAASPSNVRPGQVCVPCTIGGVVRVPIVDGVAAGTRVAQSIGLTADKLALARNHLCLHFQIARYFAEGRVAIVPDWNVASRTLCPLRTVRVAVLDDQLLLDPVLQNPECVWSQQQAIVLDESSSLCVANLHGRVLAIAEEDWPSLDVLAVNIWYTFRKALEDGRRLPKIDPVTGCFSSEFAAVTDELFEHICSLCIALFEEAVPDQRLRKNFVKAMRLGNAVGLVRKGL